MSLRFWLAIQRLDVGTETASNRRMIVRFVNHLVHRASRACETPCGCGSGKWPCHIDVNKAVELVLSLVRPNIGCGVMPETGWRDSSEEAIDAWQTRYKPRAKSYPKCGTLPLTEAQRLRVCRFCRKRDVDGPGLPFVYNFGKEYAHEACLKRLTRAQLRP